MFILIIFGFVTGGFIFIQRGMMEQMEGKLKEITPTFEFVKPKDGEEIQNEITIQGRG